MNEEIQALYEKLSACFEERKFSDLRMTLLDMEPFDIAQFIEDNLEEKARLLFLGCYQKS